MITRSVHLVLGIGFAGAAWTGSAGADDSQLSLRMEKDRVVAERDGTLVTAYRFARDQKYPYFWPVNGPASDKSITTESSEPYPHHHSLFFGCDRVNGGNYWQASNEEGQIVSQGPEIQTAQGTAVVFTDECLWRKPGKAPVIRDRRRIAVQAPDDATRIIDFAITLEPLVDVVIRKTNHALFSARVVPELSVEQGGVLVNAHGDRGEKATFGKKAPWCDYSGAWASGVTEGIAILQHPDNRWYPAPWFTRDYGFFSPTPMYWLEGGRLELPKGEAVTLKYRVIVHEGSAEAAGIAEHFDRYRVEVQAFGSTTKSFRSPWRPGPIPGRKRARAQSFYRPGLLTADRRESMTRRCP